MEGKEKPEKETDYSRLVGRNLMNKGTCIVDLPWAATR